MIDEAFIFSSRLGSADKDNKYSNRQLSCQYGSSSSSQTQLLLSYHRRMETWVWSVLGCVSEDGILQFSVAVICLSTTVQTNRRSSSKLQLLSPRLTYTCATLRAGHYLHLYFTKNRPGGLILVSDHLNTSHAHAKCKMAFITMVLQ